MKHRNRAARRRVRMFLSKLIWRWRQRVYLFSASGLAVFLLMYVSQARSCSHSDPNPPLSWPDKEVR
jgi:hypothetical protein